MHVAPGQQCESARAHQGQNEQLVHGALMGGDVTPPDGTHADIKAVQRDDRQQVNKAEGSDLPQIVDPEAGQGDEAQKCHPEISDHPVALRALGQQKLRRAKQQSGKGHEGMGRYDKARLIEWSE